MMDLSTEQLLTLSGFGDVPPPQGEAPIQTLLQSPPSALMVGATALLNASACTNAHYETTTLHDAIRGLYSRIKDDAERKAFDSLVYGAFKRGEDAQEFLASCQALSNGNPFGTLLSMEDLLVMPPKEWLIDSLIGKGDLGMVYGGSGTGKTHVIVNFIIEACTGGSFANRFKVNRPLSVAYCAGEGVSGLPARFKAAMAAKGIEKLDNFRLSKQAPQLHADKQGQRPDAHIGQFVTAYQQGQAEGRYKPLDLLIIDTLHSATIGADENSAGDMGRALESCKEAIRMLDCAVILVHHTGKNGESERGSSSLRGAMDVMIQIKRVSEVGTKAILQCTKLKDGEEWKPQTFDLVASGDSVTVWWDDPADESSVVKGGAKAETKRAILDFLNRHPGKEMTAKTLAEFAGVSQNYAIELLSDLVKQGECSSKLLDESKQSSSRNPLVYFIHSVVIQ